MSTTQIGRECVIYFNGTAIAHGKGARVGLDAGLIKDYEFESQDPALLRQGNRSYPFSIDLLWVDDCDFLNWIQNSGDAVIDIEIYPIGSGDMGFTLGSIVFTSWEVTIEQEGAVLESCSGEGKTLACGAYTP